MTETSPARIPVIELLPDQHRGLQTARFAKPPRFYPVERQLSYHVSGFIDRASAEISVRLAMIGIG